MDEKIATLILKGIGLISLIFLSFFSARMIRYLKLEEYGSDRIGKQQAISKLTWNHYVFSSLCMLIVVRLFEFISSDLFIALFIMGLSALGFKITSDILKKE